jgi:hypothetical protein
LTSSSMSTSLADGRSVSVVIGSNAPPARLAACLEALEPQRDDAVEVLVHEGAESPAELRERFPWARFTVSPGALVPEHWRDGFRAASGDVVAFTISQMVPAGDWIESIRRLLAEHEAVGGAIDPGKKLRLIDWAEYFCRYARDMRPFTAGKAPDLPGDNVAFSRARLEEIAPALETGYWEPVAHPELERRGVTLWQSPELVVGMGRSAGFGAFASQRLEHGRRYGHQRGERFSRMRNLIGVAAAPAVPALMTLRVVQQVFAKRRYRGRVVLALPAIVAYNVVWAYAEARGHFDMLRR